MNITGNIDRRALLAAGVAAPIATGATPIHSYGATMRPNLTLRQTAADVWRWCSWSYDGACWRPVRGMVRSDSLGGAVVIGPLPPQDRAELVALLREAIPDRTVSFAPER